MDRALSYRVVERPGPNSSYERPALRSESELSGIGGDSRVEARSVTFVDGCVHESDRQGIADEMAAFGNACGGCIVFRNSDTDKDHPMSRAELDTLEEFIDDVCYNSVQPPLPFLTHRLTLSDRLPAMVVEIEPSALVHKSRSGYLTREGGFCRELSPERLERLIQWRDPSQFFGPDDAIVPDSDPNSLDAGLVRRFLSSRSADPAAVQLQRLGLVRSDDTGVPRVTVAGLLFCSRRPEFRLGGAAIEAVRYRDVEPGRVQRHDSETICGPIDRQVREAVRFVQRYTWVAARKDPGRIETPQFSPRAVFEAVVNAIVHRDYTMDHARIRLLVFDDRLELYSPGALPGSLSIKAMRSRQVTRNQTIASALRLLEVGNTPGADNVRFFLEQRCEGVHIVHEETLGLSGREPQYELIDGAELRLTLPAARPPRDRSVGEISVAANGTPVAGAQVVVLNPKQPWMEEVTDASGRVAFAFFSDLPITVFCAAPGYRARVLRDWKPPEPLEITMEPHPSGGSVVFPEQTGQLPGMAGRLASVLNRLDRIYLHSTSLTIDGGAPQPVYVRLNRALRLTDRNGVEMFARVIEMVGRSALLEYEPATATATRLTGDLE